MSNTYLILYLPKFYLLSRRKVRVILHTEDLKSWAT